MELTNKFIGLSDLEFIEWHNSICLYRETFSLSVIYSKNCKSITTFTPFSIYSLYSPFFFTTFGT